jgi:hypothetical protein
MRRVQKSIPHPKKSTPGQGGRRCGVRPPDGSCSVCRMAWRAVWVVMLLMVGGCSPIPPYRDLCDQDANPDCCPRGSHQVFQPPAVVLCVPDEGLDAGVDVCEDADDDAH